MAGKSQGDLEGEKIAAGQKYNFFKYLYDDKNTDLYLLNLLAS